MDKFSDADDSEISCSDSDPSDDNMEEHKLKELQHKIEYQQVK